MVAIIAFVSIIVAATQVSALAVHRSLVSRQTDINMIPTACQTNCTPLVEGSNACAQTSDYWACACHDENEPVIVACGDCILKLDSSPPTVAGVKEFYDGFNNNCTSHGHTVTPLTVPS